MAIKDSSLTSLLASTSISANGTSTALTTLGGFNNIFLELNCSAVPTGGTPTLDVYLQTSVDAGSAWQDIAHTQFTTSAAKRFIQIASNTSGATAILASSDAALAGETIRQGPWGERLRLKWVFVAGGSSGGYTLAAPMHLN